MAKYVIVAHQTVTNPYLLDKLQQLHTVDPEAEFTLLVPVLPAPTIRKILHQLTTQRRTR